MDLHWIIEGHGTVVLYTPADIVQNSFIVQDSISHLNLELCQSYTVFDDSPNSDSPSFTYSREIIGTEEKCRKVLEKSRSLLYTLHLDLPRDKELSLRGDSQHGKLSYDRNVPQVPSIHIDQDFYTDVLTSLIQYACTVKDHRFKLKIFKWLIKFEGLDLSEFHQLPHFINNLVFECMYSALDDCEFVMKCLTKQNVFSWLLTDEASKSDRLINLLYQIHRIRKNPKYNIVWGEELVDFCISISLPQFVGDVLKFKNAPSFCDQLFYYYVDGISYDRATRLSEKAATTKSIQRQTLLLQAFWMYLRRSEKLQSTTVCLRLIWNSVPDSLLSLREIEGALEEGEEGFSPADITEVYNYYSQAVGASHSYVEPRTLMHYCRTSLRRVLSRNGHWLPEGIKELGLPKKMESYLNLES